MSDCEEIKFIKPKKGERKLCPFMRGNTMYSFECRYNECMLWDNFTNMCAFNQNSLRCW